MIAENRLGEPQLLTFSYDLEDEDAQTHYLDVRLDKKQLYALANSVAEYIQEIYEDDLEEILSDGDVHEFDFMEDTVSILDNFDHNYAIDNNQKYGPITDALMKDNAKFKQAMESGECSSLAELIDNDWSSFSIEKWPEDLWQEIDKILRN